MQTFFDTLKEMKKLQNYSREQIYIYGVIAKYFDEDIENITLKDNILKDLLEKEINKNNSTNKYVCKNRDIESFKQFKDIEFLLNSKILYKVKNNVKTKLLLLSSGTTDVTMADITAVKTLQTFIDERSPKVEQKNSNIMVMYLPPDKVFEESLKEIGKFDIYYKKYGEIRDIALEAAQQEIRMGKNG